MGKYRKMDIRYSSLFEERAIRHFLLQHASLDYVAKQGFYSVYIPEDQKDEVDPVQEFIDENETMFYDLLDIKDADITCVYSWDVAWFKTPLGTKFKFRLEDEDGQKLAEVIEDALLNFIPDEYAISHFGEMQYPLDLGMILEDGKRAKAAMAFMVDFFKSKE